jgi:hypothetical protein
MGQATNNEDDALCGLAIGDTVVIDWEATGKMVGTVTNVDARTGSAEVGYLRMEPVYRKSWCKASGLMKASYPSDSKGGG